MPNAKSDYKLVAKGLGAILAGCPEHQISDTPRLWFQGGSEDQSFNTNTREAAWSRGKVLNLEAENPGSNPDSAYYMCDLGKVI